MDGMLYLEDGTFYRGKGFGAYATKVGELVFNTAMSGYQEMMTDPASMGAVVNMTYPQIGNSGVSEVDNQSERVCISGLVTRDITFRPSNRLSIASISEWLYKEGVPGVYGVDTRAITKKIRSEGTFKCVISSEGLSKERAQELLENTPLRADYVKEAGVDMRTVRRGSAAEGVLGRGLKVAALDFGAKRSLVEALTKRGCDVVLCPYDTTAEEILTMRPDGLFLTSGPGDPKACEASVKTVKALFSRIPVFGVDLGHLVLALALGGECYKLKYGHHGGNYGVLDLETGRSAITSQGHRFAVRAESLKCGNMNVTHINLNDRTVEGIRHETLPVFSVQFHPEGGPGPNDSEGLFDRFINMMKGELNA